MRTPTPLDVQLAWHTAARAGEEPAIHDEPHCGWFKRRLVKHGPFVPARIWLFSPICPETGELAGDEILQCEVDGQMADAAAQWSRLAGHPITEAEFHYLTALRGWADQHAADEPYANPREAVDWNKVPVPSFKKKEATT